MSDIPSTSSDRTKLTLEPPIRPSRKISRKHDTLKLPTPPPDPKEDKRANCMEKEFLDYLEHLQQHTTNYSRSTSTLASALVTEDAFDHLERLYKLMEQMLELRAQNAKLHRKIRDMEHLNNLEKMHKEVETTAENAICPELDKDTAFAETILESILCDPKQNLKNKGSLRLSLMKKTRNRSCSATDKPTGLETIDPDRRSSLSTPTAKKSSKVSKWTKVKAAFKWEKASATVGDSKSSDIGGSAPLEIARYLRVPSNEETAHSPSDSGAAEISTPGSLSSASSNENCHRTGSRNINDEFRSSDDEHSHFYSTHSKDYPNISPQSSQRFHKTTWAKMKDLINTKNPVRKKSRISTTSDDIQIDIEPCSDSEEVFEDLSRHQGVSSPESLSCGNKSENEVPMEIRERYRINSEKSTDIDSPESKKVSKWTKVKKAFLPSMDDTAGEKNIRDNSKADVNESVQSEINRNYRNLQKKLSIEFQEKLNEWKKIKMNASPSPTPSCSNAEEQATPNINFMKKIEEWEKKKTSPVNTRSNVQMTNETNLPPDFRKKLDEWEKIKKSSMNRMRRNPDMPRWKSTQCSKTTNPPQFEIPVISEEFKRKLEEWKQIKASGCRNEDEKKTLGDKTPSPKFDRMDSRIFKQHKDKELIWYEKELNKIEKEKGRLERERQKFMEREERISKLRRSVTSENKRDILVHTPSGFYKFEGISRKFTQKLYEWEKFKGIQPESSTFAFLNPEYPKGSIPRLKINGEDHTPPLMRSKSVDSLAVSTLNADCPLVSQPSSLSLNDVEELEKKCLNESKCSSMDYLPCSEVEIEEPEAIIVEVEDFVEETAAPLKSFVKQHNPVYQCEEVRALCEGETCLAPKIRRSESTRAQTNYNLIEEILIILSRFDGSGKENRADESPTNFDQTISLEKHKALVNKLIERIHKLQKENSAVVNNLSKDSQTNSLCHIISNLEAVQDLSLEILSMVEQLHIDLRDEEQPYRQVFNSPPIQESIRGIKCKLRDLRRHLSYICAASDSTVPLKRRLCRMKTLEPEDLSHAEDSHAEEPKEERLYMKNETRNTANQGALKKRIRYRVEHTRQKSLPDSEDEFEVSGKDRMKCPEFMRSRTVSESSTKKTKSIDCVNNKNTKIFPVVSKTTYPDTSVIINPSDSPVTIFVKTTRKLFTPLLEANLRRESFDDLNQDEQDQDQFCEISQPDGDNAEKFSKNENFAKQESVEVETDSSLPPLPASPTNTKKILRDVSPSIKLMLARYHKKITEQDNSTRSGGSSGSASPVAWRSPTSERRVRAQTERYQQELKKSSPFSIRREVQKSASQGFLHSFQKSQVLPQTYESESEKNTSYSLLKSCSAANLIRKPKIEKNTNMKPLVFSTEALQVSSAMNFESPNYSDREIIDTQKYSSNLRLQKLRKAKEEFLNYKPCTASCCNPNCGDLPKPPVRNRLSQISVDSSSSASSISPGLLVKSISAGMINISEEAYKQFQENIHREYVSLPRSSKLVGEKKSTLSSIAAKFRKVKMRRGKDKFPAVSELCRQSLVVDINETNNENNNMPVIERESLAMRSRSSSWIYRPKLFKK